MDENGFNIKEKIFIFILIIIFLSLLILEILHINYI